MYTKINLFIKKISIGFAMVFLVFILLIPLLQSSQTLAQNNEIEKDKSLTEQDVLLDLSKTRSFLKQKNISPIILQRLDDFEANYKANKIVTKKQPTAVAKNKRPFKVSKAGKVIKKKVSEFKGNLTPSVISDTKLTKNDSSLSTEPFVTLKEIIIKAESIPAEYLAEAEEIEFSQSIKDLADSLDNDPLNILNYVKNNIDYVPYYGIKKGSDSTLIERAGNDFDQSALLIALLRYSGYPARYKQGQIKLGLNQVMNLLGVEDPIVAAQLLSKTHIPYILYVDIADEPLFFVIEYAWVEAYITYDYTRGILQGGNEKMWVSMEPSLKTVYFSQIIDIIDEMSFDVSVFYEDYLSGNYDQQKPIEAYRQEIETYLTANYPELTYQDILTKSYKNNANLEFIPNTLPYEVIENIGEYSQAPANLKHKLAFTITDKDTAIELLNCAPAIYEISNKQLILTYIAASQEDQDVINSYGSIYDIEQIFLVNMKPVIKVQGAIKCGGDAEAPEIMLGKNQDLTMSFIVPQKESGLIIEFKEDIIEKNLIVGNTEGIAINTDRIVLPELRPSQDTQTTEFLSAQKLYRTALNYLDRLQQGHNELAQTLGGEFTNAATRAIVFNGIEVLYDGSVPLSFSWKGLRIDASAKVSYFSHFGQDIQRNQTRFLYIFGLNASLDESNIFEDDYDIEAMSTVKGLRLINQGQILGATTTRIDSSNRSAIDTLNISEALKTEFRTSVDAGNIIYTPTQQYTYQNWTGLVYIDLDPLTGSAGYVIGEGLNGGHTTAYPADWNTYLIFFKECVGWGFCSVVEGIGQVVSPPTPWEFQDGAKEKFVVDLTMTFKITKPLWPDEEHTWPTRTLKKEVNTDFNELCEGQLSKVYQTQCNKELGEVNVKYIFINFGANSEGIDQKIEVDYKVFKRIKCVDELLEGEEKRRLPANTGTITEEMHLPLLVDQSSDYIIHTVAGTSKKRYSIQDGIYSHPTKEEYKKTASELGVVGANSFDFPWKKLQKQNFPIAGLKIVGTGGSGASVRIGACIDNLNEPNCRKVKDINGLDLIMPEREQEDIIALAYVSASNIVISIFGLNVSEGWARVELPTDIKSQIHPDDIDKETWIWSPYIGPYYNISTSQGAFGAYFRTPKDKSFFGGIDDFKLHVDLERYYMNMLWGQYPWQEGYSGSYSWLKGKRILIENSVTGDKIVTGVLDRGPAKSTGHVAGASPEVLGKLEIIKGITEINLCWSEDQDIAYGTIIKADGTIIKP